MRGGFWCLKKTINIVFNSTFFTIFPFPSIIELIACYELRIKLEKSELIPMGRVDNIDVLAWDMGCKVGRLPSTYLSLPLGALYKSVAICNQVEERFCRRLDIWKRQYILKGGRLTLIHSTLSSMPIYFMSLFCMLMQVKLRLEKI